MQGGTSPLPKVNSSFVVGQDGVGPLPVGLCHASHPHCLFFNMFVDGNSQGLDPSLLDVN